MQTSDAGLADLALHEGEVLKAYRDPVGIWTIGLGLTAASGVVKPRPGMVITKADSDRLARQALTQNYEPRVAKAMPGASQPEFDAGVSFDWNTGAIHRASWVKAWRTRFWVGVERGLKQWRKGGGRVLPGLVARRQAEYDLMRLGIYASAALAAPTRAMSAQAARVTVKLTPEQIEDVRKLLAGLGFDPGLQAGEISRAAVTAFQRRFDLVPDGILGRATMSTLQRKLDATAKAKTGAGAAVVAVPASAAEMSTDVTDRVADVPYMGEVLLAAVVLYALWQAWSYRDIIAAWLQDRFPRIAAALRGY